MANSRKHGSDRRDRLLSTYGGGGHAAGSDLPDLGEEDVWSSAAGDHLLSDNDEYNWSLAARATAGAGGDQSRRWLSRHVGGLSLAFEDGCRSPSLSVLHQLRNADREAHDNHGHQHQHVGASSAPVNVPDWTRVMQTSTAEVEGGGYDEDGERLPPHEYLARERRRAVATSVFEGVGRTLKGRDMRRVRDAVWSQTGFFG